MCCNFAGNFLHFKTTSGGSKSECRKSPAQLWLVQVGESQSAGIFLASATCTSGSDALATVLTNRNLEFKM